MCVVTNIYVCVKNMYCVCVCLCVSSCIQINEYFCVIGNVYGSILNIVYFTTIKGEANSPSLGSH